MIDPFGQEEVGQWEREASCVEGNLEKYLRLNCAVRFCEKMERTLERCPLLYPVDQNHEMKGKTLHDFVCLNYAVWSHEKMEATLERCPFLYVVDQNYEERGIVDQSCEEKGVVDQSCEEKGNILWRFP